MELNNTFSKMFKPNKFSFPAYRRYFNIISEESKILF